MKKLFITGLGPGGADYMTPQAAASLEAADVLYGYTTYIDLIRERYSHKELISTAMTKEIDRCHAALKRADEGAVVAMVCSGDPGVYGMASPVLELAPHYPEVEVEVVPGVTAALSGAALLGAPLTHDFAVISLSDLLTPWGLILRRLTGAANADLVICLYNPSSKKRKDYLQKACDTLLEHLPGNRVCGWARNIGREDEEWGVLRLTELRNTEVDMFTTVFVGNSTTKMIGNRMVTPRGYGVRK